MAQKQQQQQTNPATLVDTFLDNLGGLETEILTINLRKVRLLEKNARYMTAAQFARLVENIRKDRTLTSVPLVAPVANEIDEDGKPVYEALSGNHRIQAAIKAGIDETPCMVVKTPLTPDRRIALQLSHNAIVGQDDPNILRDLYMGLENCELREYTGLTDDAFKLDDPAMQGLSLGSIGYEEMTVLFLPNDLEQFREIAERLGKSKSATRIAELAHYADYQKFFDTVIRVKTDLRAFNSAIALRLMADLAAERLDQIEQESKQQEEGTT